MHESVNAICGISDARIQHFNIQRKLPPGVDLNAFDGIILHYSLALGLLPGVHMDELSLEKIARTKVPKAIFLQDEYRFVSRTWDMLNHLGVSHVFSCAPESILGVLYPKNKFKGKVIPVLTSYVSTRLKRNIQTSRIDNRQIDIGYRGRVSPYWLGELAQEKIEISIHALHIRNNTDLNIDTSVREQDRLYGVDWDKYLQKCKALLCTTSGSSVVDFDGTLEAEVENLLQEFPSASFKEIKLRSNLHNLDWKYSIEALSPKFFEAASFNTAVVHYPSQLKDQYANILIPNENCFLLHPDYSNSTELVELMKSPKKLRVLTENAALTVLENQEIQESQLQELINDNFISQLDSTPERVAQMTSYKMVVGRVTKGNSLVTFKNKLKLLLYNLIYSRNLVKFLLPIWFKLPLSLRRRIQTRISNLRD